MTPQNKNCSNSCIFEWLKQDHHPQIWDFVLRLPCGARPTIPLFSGSKTRDGIQISSIQLSIPQCYWLTITSRSAISSKNLKTTCFGKAPKAARLLMVDPRNWKKTGCVSIAKTELRWTKTFYLHISSGCFVTTITSSGQTIWKIPSNIPLHWVVAEQSTLVAGPGRPIILNLDWETVHPRKIYRSDRRVNRTAVPLRFCFLELRGLDQNLQWSLMPIQIEESTWWSKALMGDMGFFMDFLTRFFLGIPVALHIRKFFTKTHNLQTKDRQVFGALVER